MNARLVAITLTLFLIAYNGKAQTPDSVIKYVDSSIYFMRTKSLFARHMPWQQISDSAQAKARNARNYKEAFPALAYAFAQLKDYHGMVASPDTFYRYPPPINFDEVLSAGIKQEFKKGNRIVTGSFGKTAYLRVPAMHVTRQADMDLRANMLRDSLCKLITQKPQGLILDLRMNGGGNSAPMISGLGPVFPNDILGYGVDRDDKLMDPVKIKDGILLDEKGMPMVRLTNTCKIPERLPIAVLIGPSTVSSGEILAVYLKQLSAVQLFGEPTPGFCNATEGFLFMDNQGYLLLSVNKIADAKKHIYQDMLVKPHIHVKSQDNYENLSADPTVQAALAWLGKGKWREREFGIRN